MRCPVCDHEESRVVDSRTSADAIRRRRKCGSCDARFTTHERVEVRLPWVQKRDGSSEPYEREKLLHGVHLACRKRPIDSRQLEQLARRIEARLEGRASLPADEIGAFVLAELRDLDPVAYVRFASVYRQFESVEQFVSTIVPLRADPE